MYYFNENILNTRADTLIVPVDLSGKIRKGSLQEAVADILGKDYVDEYLDDIKRGLIIPGTVSSYHGMGEKSTLPTIINFPAWAPAPNEVLMSHVMGQIQEVFTLSKPLLLYELAVPKVSETYKWEALETMWLRAEQLFQGPEVWLYPPEEEEDESPTVEEAMTVVGV